MNQEDAADLEKAIKSADRRTLAAVLTHLSGDPNLIADVKDRKNIERIALDLLPSFLDRDENLDPVSDTVLQAAMNLAAQDTVPSEYQPFVREQMGIGPAEVPNRIQTSRKPSILIIGGGVTGILIGRNLASIGLDDFKILERNADIGGTWWQNKYPGCRVDTPSLLYSFSFDPDPGWPHHFSYQPSLLEYVHRVAEPISDHIVTGTRVESLTWEEEGHQWLVGARDADGAAQEMRADIVIGATGFLSSAKIPKIPGQESFKGAAFHSSNWDSSIDFTGKRVAVIGTGATANQVVPALAGTAAEVIVYQRTPHWIAPHPFYGKPLTGTERWLIERVPTYLQWFRWRQFWVVGDGAMKYAKVDPNWPNQELSVSHENELVRERLTAYIKSEMATRPELIPFVTPDYPPYSKRIIVDNGWYKALIRPDVRLIPEHVKSITADGIQTDNDFSPVDVIIYATGFHTNQVLAPIKIIGRNGVDVRSRLDAEPSAYLGIALENCPNLLMTSGPNGVPVHGGAGTLLAECQSAYIISVIRRMIEQGWTTVEIRPAARQQFSADMAAANDQMVWNSSGVENWYQGSGGGDSVVLPWTLLKLWTEAKSPDFDVFAGTNGSRQDVEAVGDRAG